MMAKKTYISLNSKGEEIGQYTGSEPSKAARKVANKTKAKKIFLRQTGNTQIRVYKGSIETVTLKGLKQPLPSGKFNGDKVKVGKAEYIGTAVLKGGKLVVIPKRKSS